MAGSHPATTHVVERDALSQDTKKDPRMRDDHVDGLQDLIGDAIVSAKPVGDVPHRR